MKMMQEIRIPLKTKKVSPLKIVAFHVCYLDYPLISLNRCWPISLYRHYYRNV